MTKEEFIEEAVKEAQDQQLAFVEDDWVVGDEGMEMYNPEVNTVSAEQFLRDKLEELSKILE